MTKLMTIGLVCVLASFAQADQSKKEVLKADRDAVKAACSAEAGTANCGDKAVGTGLLKCLGAYKKANKEFKFSDGCKSAMKTLRQDRKQFRAEREAKKELKKTNQ